MVDVYSVDVICKTLLDDKASFLHNPRHKARAQKFFDTMYMWYESAPRIDFYDTYCFLQDREQYRSKSLNSFIGTIPNNGVYFLTLKGYVVYVGISSCSIYDRLNGSHGGKGHFNTKNFDGIRVIDKDFSELFTEYKTYRYKQDLEKIEHYFINLFNPYFNKARNDGIFKDFLPIEYSKKYAEGRELLLREEEEKSQKALREFWEAHKRLKCNKIK